MWEKPHLNRSTNGFIFFLRLLSLVSIVYGFHRQVTDPHFRTASPSRHHAYVTSTRKIKRDQFLTMITAMITIFLLTFGLFCTIVQRLQTLHMHLTSIILPIEFIITLSFWTMYVFSREQIISPEATAIGYTEFDLPINICLHLVPFIGLSLDFVAEMDHYQFTVGQALAIVSYAVSYFFWIVFLYSKNQRWVYYNLTYLSDLERVGLLCLLCCIALVVWLLGTTLAPIYSIRAGLICIISPHSLQVKAKDFKGPRPLWVAAVVTLQAMLNDTDATVLTDFYSLLNISRQADGSEIKNAYRKLCLMYHPDKQLDPERKTSAQRIFHKIHTAYTVLSDPKLKSIYDELGMEGVEAVWQVGSYLGDDTLHLREAIERIRREKLLGGLKSKTVLSTGVDASAAFIDWSPISDQVGWTDLAPHLSSLAITHRIDGALFDGSVHGNLTLSIATKNSSGNGVLSGSLSKPISPRLQARCEFATGRQRRLGLGLAFALSQKTSLDTLIHSTFYGGSINPGYQISLSRVWGEAKEPSAGVWSTSLSCLGDAIHSYGLALGLSRHNEASPLSLSAQISGGGDALSLGLQGKLAHQVDALHTIKIRLSTSLPVQLALGISRRSTNHPNDPRKSSLTIEAGSEFGVGLKLAYCHGDIHFIVPIYISRELSSHSFFLGAAVPSILALLAHNFILQPYQRWQRQREWQEFSQEQEALIKERRQEAHLAIDLMEPFFLRKREIEASKEGLVITKATYELASPMGSPLEPSRLPQDGFLDVTVPLQVLVIDSQLMLPEGTKSSLIGFYDVAVGMPKILRIEYSFRGVRHLGLFSDPAPVLLPLKRHLCPFPPPTE